MDIESLCDYAGSFKYVEQDFPFGEEVLVFKVGGKIFLLVSLDSYDGFNVKCDPEYALPLRETYSVIQPGYHMNKKHWNTINIHADVTIPLMQELIRHSYELVFQSLTKKVKEALASAG